VPQASTANNASAFSGWFFIVPSTWVYRIDDLSMSELELKHPSKS
jgi:hypothetical protein